MPAGCSYAPAQEGREIHNYLNYPNYPLTRPPAYFMPMKVVVPKQEIASILQRKEEKTSPNSNSPLSKSIMIDFGKVELTILLRTGGIIILTTLLVLAALAVGFAAHYTFSLNNAPPQQDIPTQAASLCRQACGKKPIQFSAASDGYWACQCNNPTPVPESEPKAKPRAYQPQTQ